MEIAIFGGTFNPPHIGHKSIVDATAPEFEQILVIPAGEPPHKELPGTSSAPTAAQRLEMCRLAFSNCEVSDVETSREGKSYTADTVRELMSKNPSTAYTILIGTDMNAILPKWYDYEWLNETVRFKVFDRSVIPISSTQIRELLPDRQGREWLTQDVYKYIVQNHLYDVKPDFDWLWEQAAPWYTEKRLLHAHGVETAAIKLATRYGADIDEARTAAILHDITKKFDKEKHLTFLSKYDILMNADDNALFHAITGAVAARYEFGASDAVCGAIRWHTTGRANMTLLEKIIYLADYIEETRDFPGLDELRTVAFTDIDAGMLLALKMTIGDLTERGIEPAETGVTFDYFNNL